MSPARTHRRVRNGVFDLVAPFWDRLAGRWALGHVTGALELEPGLTVLDLAGGTGRLARHLAARGSRVIVLDLSRPMARRAARRGLPAAQARAESLPLPGGRLDRVVVVDAFHHMAHLEDAAREIARVLAPGGLAVLFEPDPESFIGGWVARLERWTGFGSLLLSPPEAASLFREQGLEVEIQRASFHMLLTCRKAPQPGGSGSF